MSSKKEVPRENSGGDSSSLRPAPKTVSAVVVDGCADAADVEVFEIASMECKFVFGSKIAAGTPLTLIFQAKWNDEMQAAVGVVHWCREVKGEWHVGVLLDSHLSPEFAPAMGEDIRLSLRYEVCHAATVRFQSSDELYPVVVEDYSMSGICCSLDEQNLCRAGEQFELLKLDGANETVISEGYVAWVREASEHGRYTFGAVLLNSPPSWFYGL